MNGPDFNRLALLGVLAGALAAAGPAWSQALDVLAFDAASTFDTPMHAPLGALASPGMSFITSEAGSSRLVKGAPYRAEAVSESTQVLMDGNRIVRRSVQRLARDGEGRTRVERLRADGSVESVIINDVVAGKRFWLLPEKKRVIELGAGGHVIRMHGTPPVPTPGAGAPQAPPAVPATPAVPAPPAPPASMTGDEARSWGEAMRRWAREFAGRMRSERAVDENVDSHVIRDGSGNMRVIIKQTRTGGDVDGRAMDLDVVRVIEPGGDMADSATAAIAAMTPLPLDAGPSGQGVTTALGSKEFERVRADGTRTTWTIAAGKIGNEKPIEVVSERWYAPDLLLVVSSRYLDPRRGETTYRLNGLKRGEPEPALFQVPSDYEKRPRGKREERGGN